MKLTFKSIPLEKFKEIPPEELDKQTVYVVDNGDLWVMNTNMGNDFRVVDELPLLPSEDVGYTIKSTGRQHYFSEGEWRNVKADADVNTATDTEVNSMLDEVFGEEA